MVWFIVGFFVWPIFLFRWMIRRQTRLLVEGTPVTGLVTQVVRMKRTSVVYQFHLPTGETMYGRSTVNQDATPEPGGQVCVLYNSDNPRRNAAYPLPMVRLAEE